MTAAQRAMATAFIYPNAEKGGRGKEKLFCFATFVGVLVLPAALLWLPLVYWLFG